MFYDFATENQAIYWGILIDEASYLSQLSIQHVFKHVVESFGHSFLNQVSSKTSLKGLWRQCLDKEGVIYNDSILDDHIDFVATWFNGNLNATGVQDPVRWGIMVDYLDVSKNPFTGNNACLGYYVQDTKVYVTGYGSTVQRGACDFANEAILDLFITACEAFYQHKHQAFTLIVEDIYNKGATLQVHNDQSKATYKTAK